ncbi:hypothetical protein BKK81_05980 [Cupriavidus sp. USMAHM13]|uniref:helix-turn-helix transcriptional regulator n=1 Tax=Cupriavidus sp. USMAHM13 TaxID=1389192 RepID=UPI0008A67A6B|nr:helix-turn-helix transcriptional regulator [Cupriavidus sp. USMAHM13]AOY98866.1 hypothetical protein BKK81_05980 [Cupriavidus sp. USMAHM13]
MHSTTSFRRAKDAVQAVASGQGCWLDVIRTARDFLGADSASFVCHDKASQTVRYLEHVGVDEQAVIEYGQHFFQYDDSRRRYWYAPAGTWSDSCAEREHETAHDRLFWTDFMLPHQMRQLTGVVVCNDDEVMCGLSVQRTRVSTPSHAHADHLAEYGRLLTHAYAARRLAAQRGMDLLGQVLDGGRESYLVCRSDGYVQACMPALEALLCGDSYLSLQARRLVHREPAWQARLLAGIRQVAATGRPAMLAMPDGWGRSLRVAMRPVDNDLNQGLSDCVGMRVERRNIFDVPNAEMLAELFALTPAEARLCHHLAAGLTVDDCSKVLEVSLHTLRKQLSAILRKTGCTRQAELMRLVTTL